MRKILLALMLALAAAPAQAVILFNDGDPMTTASSFTASKRPPGGGVILHVSGTFDGATVALEVNGGDAWIASDTCEAMTAAQVCRAAIGPVDLRVTLSAVGAGTSISVVGFEAQAVVASSGGGAAAATWAAITGGTSTEAFLVGTGGSFGPTGTGTVAATSAAALDADGDGVKNLSIVADDLAIDANDDGTAEFVFDTPVPGIKTTYTSALLRFWTNGTLVAEVIGPATSPFSGIATQLGAGIKNVAPSCTAPTVVPYRENSTTGAGYDSGTGALCWSDSGVEVLRAFNDGTRGVVTAKDALAITGNYSAVPTVAAGPVQFIQTNAGDVCYCTSAGCNSLLTVELTGGTPVACSFS